MLHRIKNRVNQYLLKRYRKTLALHCKAPYPLAILDKTINLIKKNPVFLIRNYMDISDKSKINCFFRIDVDTKKCIERLPIILDIINKNQINPGFYFKMDNEEYNLIDNLTLLNSIAERYEVGLHTSAYAVNDSIKVFEDELSGLENLLNKKVKSFTLHGLGKEYTDKKNDIQDCHLNTDNERYILNDFAYPPENLISGSNILILLHPVYWTFERTL